MVLVILKRTRNVRYAAYLFIGQQLTIGFMNQCLRNFELDVQGAFWTMVVMLFAFFILGTRWGWAVTLYGIGMITFGILNKESGYTIVHFDIPPNQTPPDQPFTVFIPLLINIYSIHRMVITRKTAEAHIGKQKELLEASNRKLELKNEDIVSSINYAKRIQYAVLPNEDTIYRSIPLSCIVYQPRDIVSGDFFWFHEIDRDNYIIVCADCTGHGVPGAFMTVIGSNLLTQIVTESKITSPSAARQTHYQHS